MFRDVVLQDTTAEEWVGIREKILERVMSSMGEWPDEVVKPEWEVMGEYESFGLRHVKIRYRVLSDAWNMAVVVFPEGVDDKHPGAAVIASHGTSFDGKYRELRYDDEVKGRGIELARRGFVVVAPDQFGFGEPTWEDDKHPGDDEARRRWIATLERFSKNFPRWSIDGRRLWDHQRLLDVMGQMKYIRAGKYGVMGNSLGGRMSIYLSALDERVAASVPSCGISPNLTNVYRVAAGRAEWNLSPDWVKYMFDHGGKMSFDYADMIALNAPRPLLLLEPYNDPFNPYIMANFECYVRGQRVYQVLGKPECFGSLTHGDGHGIPVDVREYAYRWLERWLK